MPRRETENPLLLDDPLWYKDAIIYELMSNPFVIATGTA